MNNNEYTPEELCLKLKSMKLSAMADKLEEQTSNPNIDLVPASKRIAEMIEAEWDLRYNKKFARYLKKASLRYPDASLDDTIYDPIRELDTDTIEALLDCNWIDSGRNLLITGKSGGGKSYFSNILAINALRKFKTVKYIKTRELINLLEKANYEGTYLEMVKSISQLDLLIIDDFGLMSLDEDKCRYLFEVIDAREGRKSLIVVSQLPVNAWYPLFSDNTYADACLDRLVCNAFRLNFNGKNMRNPNL